MSFFIFHLTVQKKKEFQNESFNFHPFETVPD